MYNYQNTIDLINMSGSIILIIIISITLILLFSPIVIINNLKKINRKMENIENTLLEQNNILITMLNENEQKKEKDTNN